MHCKNCIPMSAPIDRPISTAMAVRLRFGEPGAYLALFIFCMYIVI